MQDSLFRYIVRELLSVEPSRTSKAELLGRLRDKGVFLVDVSEEPIGPARLTPYVPGLVRRCVDLRPEAVILIKVTVYDAAFVALKSAGLPVIDRRVPFPGSGQQRRFEEQFRGALRLARWANE